MAFRATQSGVALRMPQHSIQGMRVLLVDLGDASHREISALLQRDGCDVEVVTTLTKGTAIVRRGDACDVCLVALGDRKAASQDVFVQIGTMAERVPVVAIVEAGAEALTREILRAGAEDYVLRPAHPGDLRQRLARAVERTRRRREREARLRELESSQARISSLNQVISQRIQAATELQAQVEDLGRENVSLMQTRDEQERFVAMVAHELRGPLNPIINYAQLLKRSGLSAQQVNQYTDQIVANAFRLNRLVDDLYTATHLRTGQFSLTREECDVSQVARELVDSFSATVPERQFLFESDGPSFAEIDRTRIAQAVRNLLDNAVKYSTEGGSVEVRVWSDEMAVHIGVRDHGLGIPEDQMTRIFDAFMRLERRPEVIGSGLGLFITRGIVEAHGGELRVANATGPERARGAVFTIILPRLAPAAR